ncbi:flagellar basal body rod modification protein [Methylobacterium sp. Leaf469]|jgi:flagellar basal-body rod modification protein FlgD|uniref:flagellar hook assembly protein FlgD n=1 Tax=unclassified Methylobacterium TaxID=2615210 RepID=UPI0006F99C0B|nr:MULTISPECIES: flagellar hook assembly protein FlgD [unclassified Methylobacterium]USU33528.1 flagellar hook assembly protein FlgD [Methylobacterium sp. OTU13CASTA1]KQO69489.1 flagellar basal body rod modification protein [Methylobacterium sp. Leaf87]KQP34425.1 flagellar basal body rod modification protein [Methylobacterium sp. Leaf102]KQP36821.1 flagellar basal body rod modification protein [Methylobacterium sp. Leaf100]KQP72218.1 flagellar basal body rod modification protein [Methylobacter
MAVGSSTSTPPTQTATAATAAKSASGVAASMNADTFLTLLMAQLKNQDPTKPMDSTAYVGELATFSQVEQATKTNSKLDSLLSSSFLSQADQIIGRTITSADGNTTGEVQSVKITSEGALARLTNGKDVLLAEGISLSQ